jgi:hypothetical protein
MAEPSLFENQFELFSRYLTLGLDLYAYVTLTSPSEVGIEKDISRFVDRLQSVASYLPLRVVPLEVRLFDAVHGRVHAEHERALDVQWVAVRCWLKELEHRFSAEDRAIPIYEIPLY